MPQIPYSFNYGDDDYSSHLKFSENEGITKVEFQYVNLPLCFEAQEDRYYPSLDSIAKHTPGFENHNLIGFSLGNYSEFLVYHPWAYEEEEITYYLGNTEISLGQATPLAKYLFDNYHEEKYFGEMDSLRSLRIVGIDRSNSEQYFLYALIKLHEEFGICMMPLKLDDQEEDFDGFKNEEIQVEGERFSPPILAKEPLRFYFDGMMGKSDKDNFLSFYRVLEFYSLVPHHGDISSLRSDSSLSVEDFIKKTEMILKKEERSLICQLISRIADSFLSKEAAKHKLIQKEDIATLANALYDFRNSIVHAKISHLTEMYSESLFEESSKAHRWMLICRELAKRAFEQYGKRIV